MKVKTTPTAQADMWNVESAKPTRASGYIRPTSGFQFFIAFLNFGRFSSDLILFGISSHTFGARYDTDSVPQYTVLTDLVVKVHLLLISKLEDVLKGKASFVISRHLSLNTLYNSMARYFSYVLRQSYLSQVALQMKIDPHYKSCVNIYFIILLLSFLLCIIHVKRL